MATKPTIANARFADVGGADVVAPTSGLRDTGFVAGTAIVQSLVNYLLNQFYQWSLYLSEGALSGPHTFDADVDIAGDLSCNELQVNSVLEAMDGVFIGNGLEVGQLAITFADFTYTANASTDTLTATNHGRETGDGPVRTTNSGGGLPGGLAINTDYYVIATGTDTFKLATSRSNALFGTAIDITSTGTGTHTLIDQPPTTTRVSDATVSRDLVVDGIVTGSSGVTAGADRHVTVSGTGEYKHGDRQLALHVFSGTLMPSTWSVVGGSSGHYLQSGGDDTLLMELPLATGDRIKSIEIEVFGNGTADLISTAYLVSNGNATLTSLGAATATNPAATWATLTNNVTDTVLASGQRLTLELATVGSGLRVRGVTVTYDRP